MSNFIKNSLLAFIGAFIVLKKGTAAAIVGRYLSLCPKIVRN
jgi:hypothetical protein